MLWSGDLSVLPGKNSFLIWQRQWNTNQKFQLHFASSSIICFPDITKTQCSFVMSDTWQDEIRYHVWQTLSIVSQMMSELSPALPRLHFKYILFYRWVKLLKSLNGPLKTNTWLHSIRHCKVSCATEYQNQLFFFTELAPLGCFSHRVAMPICLCVCLSVCLSVTIKKTLFRRFSGQMVYR